MKIQQKIIEIKEEIKKLDNEIRELYAISAYKLHQIKINERDELFIILKFLNEHQKELKRTKIF